MSEAALAVPGAGGGVESAPPVESTPVDSGVETPVLDAPVDSSIETPDAPIVEATPEQATQDGRTIPVKHRDYFKANPDIRAAWFENVARKEIHPTVQAARADAELVQEIGGRDGYAEIQKARETQEALDGDYYSREPQRQRNWIKNALAQDKSAFTSVVPIALDEWFQADAKGYNRVMSRVVANTFAGAFNRMGVQNYLAQAAQLLGTNPEQAKQMLTSIGEWMGQFEQIANQQPEVDPREQEFEQKVKAHDEKVAKEAEEAFQQTYKTASGTKAISLTLKHVESVLGDVKYKSLDEEARGDVMRAVFQKVNGIAMKDANYLRQMKAILSRKDAASAERYFLAKFNQLLPDAAKKVMRLFNLSGPAPKPAPSAPAAAQPTAKPGWVMLSKAPSPNQIARPATTDAMIMRNEAILRDGKKVRWPQSVIS